MAIKPFNSVAGFSVGEIPANVVLANGDIITGNIQANANVIANGNITATYFLGNGSQLTGIDATSIQNGNSNVKVYANANVEISAYGNANVTTITGTGLIVAGTISASGNTTAGNLSTAGNVNAGNLVTTGLLSAIGNANVGNIGATAGVFTTVAGSLTTAAQPNITSVGSLTSLSVIGNANIGNIGTAGLIAATGNITGGNIVTGGVVSATGNISGGNLSITGTSILPDIVGANITTVSNANLNIEPNGTGVVTSTANIHAPNFIGNVVGNISGNITVGGANTQVLFNDDGLAGANANFTFDKANALLTVDGVLSITGNASFGGNVNLNSQWINNLANPSVATDAATKQYVDDAVSAGLTIHTPVYVESPNTAGSLNATYADGGTTQIVTTITGNKTLQFGTSPALAVNDIIVFATTTNGLTAGTAYFVYSTNGSNQVTLSATFDGVEITSLTNGTGLSISSLANSGVGATLTSNVNEVLVIDGVTMTGGERVLIYNQTNAFENGVYVVTDEGSVSTPWILTRSSDTNTYGPKSTSQLDNGDYFFVQAGDSGAGESYVCTSPAGVIIFGTTNITFTQFSASQVYSAGTGLTLTGTTFSINTAQPTITSTGTLTSLSVSGNAIAGNIATSGLANVGSLTVTGVSNLGSVSNVTITGGSANYLLQTNGSGALTWVAPPSTSTILNGTSNISIPTADGNVNTSVGGNANVFVVTATGANLTGTFSISGNANIGNIGTAGLITSTGNITGGNINTANTVTANTVIANTSANIGSTKVGWGTVTTSNIDANQTIAQFSTTGISAIEFLVKGEDSTGAKYSVATVTAVTDGTNVDYATYATAFLTAGTGVLAVNISGGNVALQVTPSSSNSTVWTTQYRVM